MEQRGDEWQMKVRALYNFVEETQDLKEETRRQQIKEQFEDLREFWDKKL